VLKLVADTNTVVSALLWHGAPHRLFEAIGTGELSFRRWSMYTRTPLSSSGRATDDEAVIACALAARADLIVSGDQDLLVLKRYRRIRILNAAEALAIIRSR
jgi:predicted nucleic acid-binding protein